MRHFKIAALLAIAALAVSATPALAHEFIASKAGKTHGIGESEQTFKFGPFKITCQRAAAKGSVAAGSSKTYAATIKFAKCLTTANVGAGKHAIFLPTRWETPLSVEYHASGFVETGDGELEEEAGKAIIAGGSAELKVHTAKTEEGEKSECNISWPEQVIPLKAAKAKNPEEEEFGAASYAPGESFPKKVSSKFPDGLQHTLVISNTFKGIKFELEGEPCEEWGKEEGPEGGGGTYVGSFPQTLGGGSLEFQ
jgi:hypothetical protein